MDAIKIPQNVHIEDRIIGPLTLRQVIICILGFGCSYAMWASISKAYGLIALPIQIVVWIPGVLSLIFAFIRINDITMFRLCLLLLERLAKPAVRTWAPRRGIVINIRTLSATTKQEGEEMTQADIDRKESGAMRQIAELSTILDRRESTTIDDGDEDRAPIVRMTIPVDPARVTVDPLDTSHTRAAVTLMRDVSPPRPQAL